MNMKKLRFLFILIIGVAFLNSIFAATVIEKYYIKGDLVLSDGIVNSCSAGSDSFSPDGGTHYSDNDVPVVGFSSNSEKIEHKWFFAGGNVVPDPYSCTLEIYSPNDNNRKIYEYSDLSATAIKGLLNQGIMVGPIQKESNTDSYEFLIKIVQNAQIDNILIQTRVKVPNINSNNTTIISDSVEIGSVFSRHIANSAITFDKLSQDVIDYIDSKEQVNNISNITEVTEVNMVDISDDSIGLNHLNQDLRNKIGSVQELPQDIYEDLSEIETIYYIVRDESTGSSYYIPVLKSTEFKLDAIRDLITYGEFDDSNYERNTSPGYSSVFPPTNSAKKYSDFIYPRTNRKYITAGKYIPIDITITDSGTQDYEITFFECEPLYDISAQEGLNHLLNNYYLVDCAPIQVERIKGETIDQIFTDPIIVSATENDGYSGRFHILGSDSKHVIYTNIVQTTDNEHTVSKISSGVVHIYPPITNIEHTGGYDQLCSVQQSGIPPFTQLYTYRIPDLQFIVTGGSSGSTSSGEEKYLRWNIDISAGDGEYHSVVMDKSDNKQSTFHNLTFTTQSYDHLNVIVWIKDTRTGQRFAKYFSIGPCTNQN